MLRQLVQIFSNLEFFLVVQFPGLGVEVDGLLLVAFLFILVLLLGVLVHYVFRKRNVVVSLLLNRVTILVEPVA